MNGTIKLIVQAGAMKLQHNFVDKDEASTYLIQIQPKKCKEDKGAHGAAISINERNPFDLQTSSKLDLLQMA